MLKTTCNIKVIKKNYSWFSRSEARSNATDNKTVWFVVNIFIYIKITITTINNLILIITKFIDSDSKRADLKHKYQKYIVI